jgi:hypothetical protein
VIVEPGVQPVSVNVKSPCGKIAGAVPAGGLAGLLVTGMNCGLLNVQPGPPPVKLAVIVPEPVADGPE